MFFSSHALILCCKGTSGHAYGNLAFLALPPHPSLVLPNSAAKRKYKDTFGALRCFFLCVIENIAAVQRDRPTRNSINSQSLWGCRCPTSTVCAHIHLCSFCISDPAGAFSWQKHADADWNIFLTPSWVGRGPGGGVTGAVCNELDYKASQVDIVHNKRQICQMWLKINLSVLLDLFSSFSSLIQTGWQRSELPRAELTPPAWLRSGTSLTLMFLICSWEATLFNLPPYQWTWTRLCSLVVRVGATYCASMNCVYTNGHYSWCNHFIFNQ